MYMAAGRVKVLYERRSSNVVAGYGVFVEGEAWISSVLISI
jgi:hypothetical protein